MARLETLMGCLPQPPEYRWDWAGLRALEPIGSLIARMEKTPQNPVWHGEGDVWAHTRLVCEALAKQPEFQTLTGEDRDALALAALLHDSGKTLCTRWEDNRWRSPKHGAIGARLVRRLLWLEFGLCGRPDARRLRERVCQLVRWHMLPPHLCEKEDAPTRALLLAADGELIPGFTLQALFLLGRADALGRVAPDVDELVERVALARELAAEAGCLDGPYPFASARTERALFSGSRVWKDQVLYDDSWGEVTLMCGLPGAGKDTWLREQRPGLPVVSLDALRRELGVSPEDEQGRVVQAAKEQARAFLRAKQPFAWNATCLTPLRSQLVELFEGYGARVRIVYLETDWKENLRRNAARAAAVPEDVIGHMLDRLELPRRSEAQAVEWLST